MITMVVEFSRPFGRLCGTVCVVRFLHNNEKWMTESAAKFFCGVRCEHELLSVPALRVLPPGVKHTFAREIGAR
jgi:hypothetical protein